MNQTNIIVLIEMYTVYVFAITLLIAALQPFATANAENEAKRYLETLEPIISRTCNFEKQAAWDYVTNVTSQTQQRAVEAAKQFTEFQVQVQAEVLDKFSNWRQFTNNEVRRQIEQLASLGPGSMSKDDQNVLADLKLQLDKEYSLTKICKYKDPKACGLGLADVDKILSQSKDYDELEYYWSAWHNTISVNVNVSNYREWIYYQNLVARQNGFSDLSEQWLAKFNPNDTPNWSAKEFKKEMIALWSDIQPYYNILHAYIRMKLRQNPEYAERFPKDGAIPSNLLRGFGLSKSNLLSFYEDTKPFPNVQTILETGTAALKKSGYTVKKIFEASDDFFHSLGLPRMTPSFWNNSMFEDPRDGRIVNCVPPFEWDMCHGHGNEDFRIKVCGEVNSDYFVIIHHEMGHMVYFMEYTNEPYVFRDGGNPGFHEGIGNLFQLPVGTPRHFECVLGLDVKRQVDCKSKTPQTPQLADINYLYNLALDKLPFLAYTIALEEWRWEVFEERLTLANYNPRWWELRQKYQGIQPPTSRPEQAFDAATRIITTPNYIRYFNSFLLQFQFFESFCKLTGQGNDPMTLHQCDFTGSLEVGNKLRNLLKSGFSRPWPKLLQEATGQSHVSAQPILNFFKPLFIHLKNELILAGELIDAKKY